MKPQEFPRVWVQIIPRKKMGNAKREGFNVYHKQTRTFKHEYVHITDHLNMIADKNKTIDCLQSEVEKIRQERDSHGAMVVFWKKKAVDLSSEILSVLNLLRNTHDFLEMVSGKSVFYPLRMAFRDACGAMAKEVKEELDTHV